MKILQINGYESPGKRFHGLSITPLLKEYGVESKHFVWYKDTKNPAVITLTGRIIREINFIISQIERLLSLQSVLYTNAKQIIELAEFKEADLIHLHLIHTGFFSIRDLKLITSLKPTVWTLHDPWAMTGHCIYPRDCTRWKIGCGNCPDLKTYLPLLNDNTKFLFEYKKRAYKKAQFDLIVASQWMKDLVEASPMFDKTTSVHQVPFGLDLNFFDLSKGVNARAQFGIPENSTVICFRSDTNEFKGLPYVLEALDGIHSESPICILTLSGTPQQERLGDRFQVIDLGWINDEEIVRNALMASDIFLMPSIAEAFGLMAVEAMACSKPVIVFEGTSLPKVVSAPDVGIAVPMKDSGALMKAIQHLVDNPKERLLRGKKGRKLVEKKYNINLHIQTMIGIYKKVISNWSA